MESQLKAYKIATWVLAVVVVVLMIFLFTKTENNTVSDNLQEIADRLADCREEIAAFTPTSTSTPRAPLSADDQEKLDDIYAKCINNIQEAQDYVK